MDRGRLVQAGGTTKCQRTELFEGAVFRRMVCALAWHVSYREETAEATPDRSSGLDAARTMKFCHDGRPRCRCRDGGEGDQPDSQMSNSAPTRAMDADHSPVDYKNTLQEHHERWIKQMTIDKPS